MRNTRFFTLFSLVIVSFLGCGKLQPRVITADLLNAGNPDFYEATLNTFDSAFPAGSDIQSYPILNVGYRTGTIKTITFSDAHFVLDVTSECEVGTEIKAGESCDIMIKFTPTVLATMSIEYEGAGGDYTSEYPLEGYTH